MKATPHSRYALTTVSLGAAALLCAPMMPASAATTPSFVDPTAVLEMPESISLGSSVYVGPFAYLKAGDETKRITVGDQSNVQDSATLDSSGGPVTLGKQAIVAHGGTVYSGMVGVTGTCPDPDGTGPLPAPASCPSFVGFNSRVEGTVNKDAMVTHLARVARGVTIPSGRKVLPGKDVQTQSQVAAKTAPVTEADRAFMAGVVQVNTEFAHAYHELEAEDPSNVTGANYDPGHTDFNPNRDLPSIDGQPIRDPEYRNRIIGDVQLHSADGDVSGDSDGDSDGDDGFSINDLGTSISLRADEGEPFHVGSIASMKDRTTFHALEHTHLDLGDEGEYGVRSIVHGGPTPYANSTVTGDNLLLKDEAVLFRSRVGNDVTIGNRSYVQSSDLPNGYQVPDKTVIVDNAVIGTVEW